jgi:formylglycine-generating enzyme required for sulfatase activity
MAAKIFISYRRDDSAGHAGRVHDRLEREFGRDLLFMDVDAIPLGVNFVKVLEDQVTNCDVLLAIIGPGWLDARDDDGKRRLDNPHDYIRIEIAVALKREIPVIPILLEGVRLPKAHQLPDNLKDLVLRNGLDVRHASFHNDMDRLVRGLRGRESAQQPTPATPTVVDRMHAEGRVKFDARIVHGALEGWFLPGNGKVEWFQDCEGGPEMVVIPAGSFVMGSPEEEPQRKTLESPQHNVTIAKPFAIARCAVTRAQFTAFVNSAGHKTESGAVVWKGSKWKDDPKASWCDPRFAQDDNHPVVCVSWNDVKAYVAWLSSQTHCDYRLPTEAEWEYCCRAGSTSPFWWGSSIAPTQANYDGKFVYEGGGSKGEWRQATVAVNQFAANPWGLYQVHGNVWEWCEDVWHWDYNGAPADGSAWLEGGKADPSGRVVRGGSWINNPPEDFRSASRQRAAPNGRSIDLGFRVGRTLLLP